MNIELIEEQLLNELFRSYLEYQRHQLQLSMIKFNNKNALLIHLYDYIVCGVSIFCTKTYFMKMI